MTGKYLIVRRQALKTDGFTYGEWRQYIAFLDDDTAVCCRPSMLPLFAGFMGLGCLAIVGMVVFLALNGVGVLWGPLFTLSAIGFALLAIALIQQLTDWRLMVAVSDKMRRDGEGNFIRSF